MYPSKEAAKMGCSGTRKGRIEEVLQPSQTNQRATSDADPLKEDRT